MLGVVNFGFVLLCACFLFFLAGAEGGGGGCARIALQTESLFVALCSETGGFQN